MVTIFGQVLNIWLLFFCRFLFLLKLSSVVWYGKIQNEHNIFERQRIKCMAWFALKKKRYEEKEEKSNIAWMFSFFYYYYYYYGCWWWLKRTTTTTTTKTSTVVVVVFKSWIDVYYYVMWFDVKQKKNKIKILFLFNLALSLFILLFFSHQNEWKYYQSNNHFSTNIGPENESLCWQSEHFFFVRS